ncbi:MAG: hypothetical protein PWR20_2136, partial [Bacteroidales bacterium]|nr:hypothetical protein [Bacteroidales bacterium]
MLGDRHKTGSFNLLYIRLFSPIPGLKIGLCSSSSEMRIMRLALVARACALNSLKNECSP